MLPFLIAASPQLDRVVPRGAQRGTEVEFIFHGQRLKDAQEVFFYSPGFTVSSLHAIDDKQVKATVKVDAEPGEHALRLRCASGITELRTVWVGLLPVVAETEPNTDFDKPQKIDLNVTVAGVVENEDVDYFLIEAKNGQRISIEVEGMRLGGSTLDPSVAILDANRFELASSDDTALLLQDPYLSFVAPRDGPFVIQLRDSSYGGNNVSAYRMHVGTFPRPSVVWPPGGQTGKELAIRYLGDAGDAIEQTIKLPDAPCVLPVVAQLDGLSAPSPNCLRVSAFESIEETEPNDEPAAATLAPAAPPVAFNGIIQKPGDVDYLRFKAAKGQVLEVQVYGRRLRSPLDPLLRICDAAGKQLAINDDTAGPDSFLRFTAPADGDFLLSITDHLSQGGPEYVYRAEVTIPQPKLSLNIPPAARASQERQAIAIPRGNRFATILRASRENFVGELTVAAPKLPAGVTMICDNIPTERDIGPALFEAAADAPVAGQLCELIARHVDPAANVQGEFAQPVELVQSPTDTPFYLCRVNRLAVAVVDEAPFSLQLVQPKVPLVQSGSMNLKVLATRKDDFKGPIAVKMLYDPQGVSGGSTVTIAPEQSEVIIPLSATKDAPARKWKIAVLGSSDVGGAVWVSSQLVELEIAAPFVVAAIEIAAVEQGQTAQVLCKLEHKTPFDGKAKAILRGLPSEATAAEMEISAQDAQVIFNVTTTEKTPPGQHKSLFCELVIPKNDESIVHAQGVGGVLRVDPPSKKPEETAAAAAPPPPAPPAEKSLTRLEQLRRDQATKAATP